MAGRAARWAAACCGWSRACLMVYGGRAARPTGSSAAQGASMRSALHVRLLRGWRVCFRAVRDARMCSRCGRGRARRAARSHRGPSPVGLWRVEGGRARGLAAIACREGKRILTAQDKRVAKGSARKAPASQTRYHWQLHDIPPHEKIIIKIRAYRGIFVRRRKLLVRRSTRRPGKPSAGGKTSVNQERPPNPCFRTEQLGGSRSRACMHVARAATAATTRRRRRSLEPEPSATATPGRRVRPASP